MYRFPATHRSRYDQVRTKASHNSYVSAKDPIPRQLEFHPETPHRFGCRGLELDISSNVDGAAWSVSHDRRYYAAPRKQLGVWLDRIRSWHDRNNDPGNEHDVITVTLDIKKVPEGADAFAEGLDALIEKHLGRAVLFTPAEFLGEAEDLYAGAGASGWPTLGELAGRFVLCLSGSESAKAGYNENTARRLCFVDRKVGPDEDFKPERDMRWRLFVNADVGAWRPRLDRLKEISCSGPLVVRAYHINEDLRWYGALWGGANIIATDRMDHHEWAQVPGDLPFDLVRCD